MWEQIINQLFEEASKSMIVNTLRINQFTAALIIKEYNGKEITLMLNGRSLHLEITTDRTKTIQIQIE